MEKRLNSQVEPRTNRGWLGGVERAWDSVAAHKIKSCGPGDVERGWHSVVAPRTKKWRLGGVERRLDPLVVLKK